MASQSLTARILLKNDTAANWTSNNPVLGKGEMGIEIDTRKYKFGDGTTSYNSLSYASSTAFEIKTTNPTASDDGYELGTFWINTTTDGVYICVDNSSGAAIWNSLFEAVKLVTARNIAISGAATGNANFDGSANIDIEIALTNSGITAGTYTKVTFNSKGIATSGTSLSASDIPTLTLSKISNAGTAAAANTGTSSGNVPVLDANGKLVESVLPAIAVVNTFVVNSQAAMLALDVQVGDIAIRTDVSKTFILQTSPASTLANWQELRTPTDAVLSVNGKTGVVSLASTDLTDTAHLLRDTDTFTLNCGSSIIS